MAGLILLELGSPCADCATLRSFTVAVAALSAVLYVAGLSGVLAWVAQLRRRGVADRRAARDWYVLAAVVGLPVAPLLAFTVVSALR